MENNYTDAFYSIYPRKVAPVAYRKAAHKIKADLWPVIMEKVKIHIKYWKQQGTEKKHIPHPASWLNGERWLDELELDAEVQTESSAYTFIKAVRNKNNLTLPDLPHDIKQTFFRMGIPWGKLQAMHESEIEEKFLKAYNNKQPIEPEPIVDYKTLAAGSDA